jgi:uncharacterized protein (TIGR02996 family)
MNTIDALLAGIVSDPHEETRWLVLADWLEEHDDSRRAELLRLHRRLLATCSEPEQYPERTQWHARIVELIAEGVRPCLPSEMILLPGKVPMTFSFIPPGSFRMGSEHQDAYNFEKPIHKVTISKGSFLGVHPVTQAQWKAVMGTDPSHFKGPNRPVECVWLDDVQAFCKKITLGLKGSLTARLPTEAEWEYACRAGTTTEYHFGDSISTNQVGRSEKDQFQTTVVGSFPCNPWGLFDLHGNVFEWCEDWFGLYSAEDQTDPCKSQPEIAFREQRILRGGDWCCNITFCRSSFRQGEGLTPHDLGCYGFRVCLSQD